MSRTNITRDRRARGLPGAGPRTEGPRAAMTTGDCCHLPGSLCDCPGSAALSKSVEDSDIGRPQYITQVTAKDGRLLSTVIKALGAQSDGPICRICHEGGNGEGLLSPCDCTGTLGTVHKSCLEKWLSSSNTSYCELCHTEFVVERRPRPLTEARRLKRGWIPGDGVWWVQLPAVCAVAAALQCAGALHSTFSLSARVLCAWHTTAGGLLLEQNGSPGWEDHLVLFYYFHCAINPLILAWSLRKVTWSSVSHFPWELLQPL
ncbi:E3 ubiquitin-protein ligase MARCHF2 isoform X2 [Poecile atricapillus]|uniref:E3 ubiquitin-protein ligase MARCHF2 isoform X2 n=1 Tax=Poecile atricapillus TaxID=48891 RepID=UPI0027397A86|nr:E3 ubiquitin-protein ligase MARCHF2 isoform X2 [Poecile atricapillus]